MDEREYRITFHGVAYVVAESEEAAKEAFFNNEEEAEFEVDKVEAL